LDKLETGKHSEASAVYKTLILVLNDHYSHWWKDEMACDSLIQNFQ
jgi:hypothetical protein